LLRAPEACEEDPVRDADPDRDLARNLGLNTPFDARQERGRRRPRRLT
jgi:hypothetical protein